MIRLFIIVIFKRGIIFDLEMINVNIGIGLV